MIIAPGPNPMPSPEVIKILLWILKHRFGKQQNLENRAPCRKAGVFFFLTGFCINQLFGLDGIWGLLCVEFCNSQDWKNLFEAPLLSKKELY